MAASRKASASVRNSSRVTAVQPHQTNGKTKRGTQRATVPSRTKVSSRAGSVSGNGRVPPAKRELTVGSVASRRVASIAKGSTARKLKRAPKPKGPGKLSRTNKPEHLTLEDWQVALRRQFGREQEFELSNIGEHPVFSEFLVKNPASGNTYRVAIRGQSLGDNFCSCPDFATNELGTCKHVEFTLAKLARKRDGKAELRAGFHPPFSEVYLQYGSQRRVRFRPGTQCPEQLLQLSRKYFDINRELRPGAYEEFEQFLQQSYEIEADLRCYDDALAVIASVRDSQKRQETLNRLFPDGIRSSSFDGLMKVNLYDYQREGALFAARAGRALIGDEMGLGKTIQALATSEILAKCMGVERVLIICPTSLKYQWEHEIQKFTERSAQVINGLINSRREQFQTNTFYKILNYDTVFSDLDLIRRWAPDFVILDEAQRIKNWSTRVARSVKQVVTPYALVLTGTPLENRLEELISIVQFIDQQRLGPTYRLLHNHQDRDENGKVVGYRDLNRIGETLKPILIRRQKKEVALQLPSRLDTLLFVPMTQPQMNYHAENMQQVSHIVNKWRKFGFLNESDQRRLMIALQNMRMACDSTYLLDLKSDHGVKADELMTLLGELLETSDNKVVIFSQWQRMLSLISKRMVKRAWDHVFYHGSVESSKRKDLVERFRNDPDCRVFLATDAGGVGLNLQHANIVINMDLPWNPAVLEQRIGRVHRMGQTQPVSVINYVSQGTIEEGMLGVLDFKKNLFAGVLDGGENNVFLGGSKLKKFMESVDKITNSIPESRELPADTNSNSLAVGESSSHNEDSVDHQENARSSGHSSSDTNSSSADNRPGVHHDAPGNGSSTDPNPLTQWLQQGVGLLQQLATTGRSPQTMSDETQHIRIDRDVETGQSFLRVQLPEPQVLNDAIVAIGKLFNSLRQ